MEQIKGSTCVGDGTDEHTGEGEKMLTGWRWVAMHRRVLGEGAWVLFGSAGAALAALTGTRLLTEFVSPRVFGEFTLLLGIAMLGYQLVGAPVMQGTLRFYPDCARTGGLDGLRATATGLLTRSALWLALVWIVSCFIYYALAGGDGIWPGLLLIPLFALEIARSFEITLLTAARRQRDMAIWTVIEAWAKPVFVVLVVTLARADTASVLGGFILATGAVLLSIYMRSERASDRHVDPSLRRELLQYALPLLPLGLVGWSSGLADRYVIGGMLGIEQVGLYAAAYGLASRPVLSLCGAIGTTLRPIYYQAVSAGSTAAIRRAFFVWFGLVAGTGFAICLLFRFFSESIAYWCLSSQYRAAAIALMPWIAAGYALNAVSQVFSAISYASKNTRDVLTVQLTGAVAGLALGFAGVYFFGIVGAAIAVTAAFTVQVLVAMRFARPIGHALFLRATCLPADRALAIDVSLRGDGT